MKKVAKIFRESLTRISPKLNTEICYIVKFKKPLNLKKPLTLNEKILWLKLNYYETNPLIKQCADKFRVRNYICDKGYSKILIRLITCYDSPDKIEWDKLPKQFALKLNVGCGSNIICTDKNKLDIEKSKKVIKSWFKKKYYLGYSEMQYKDISPIIIIEEYLSDGMGKWPVDYKFYCFNGHAEYVMVCIGREENRHPMYYFYNREWKLQKFTKESESDPKIKKPNLIEEAFEIADNLSKPFPFVRTDLYIIGEQIYFGELTFTSCGGMDTEISDEALIMMGNKVRLREINAN